MSTPPTPHGQLEAMRPQLVRFAQLQLRNAALAEDALQDARVAVLAQPQRFRGASSLRMRLRECLSLIERSRMRVHLLVCAACTRFNGQMHVLRRAMRQGPPANQPGHAGEGQS